MIKKFTLVLLLAILSLADPVSAQTTTPLSGWIPYWRGVEGTADARRHLSALAQINPFAYSVKQDGSLSDLAKLDKSYWKNLFKAARGRDVAILPTVMHSDGKVLHTLLSNQILRHAHVAAIAQMVKQGRYDGVDIDYEAKLSETRDYFSTFLAELKTALGKKTLSCTIEARTPRESLFRGTPPPANPANDYARIGEICDEIRIMTYDQRRADLKLNDAHAAEPYMPVGDIAWVRKVAELAMVTLPREKIWLGAATYGHEWQVTEYPSGYREYQRIRSFNHTEAVKLAKKQKVKPERNAAGELSFIYERKTVGKNKTYKLVWWSDAEAVKQKLDLVRELNLGGLAIFKLDKGEDSGIWKIN